MYKKDKGVSKNHVKAVEWYSEACDQRYQESCDAHQKLNEKE